MRFFNDAKGWGFLQLETGEDAFVHFSAIQMEGRRTLREGQSVEFEVRDSTKGLCAENVVVIR